MDYKCIPFDPATDRSSPASTIANQLEVLVDAEKSSGWEFVGLENHATVVPGSSGCFGWGSTNPYEHTFSVAVFRR